MKNTFVTVSSLDKVFPNEPPALLQSEYTALKNEVFHFQVSCYSNDMLFDSRIEIESPLKDYITARIVEPMPAYLATKKGEGDGYVLKKNKYSTLYPDLLREVNSAGETVRKNIWTSFFITVNENEITLERGTYPITVKLYSSGNKLFGSAAFKLKIIDACLPVSDLKYTGWFHYDCISYQHKKEMFSQGYYSVLNTYIKSAVSHGMTMLYTPLFTPPLDTAKGFERQTAQLVDVTVNESGGYTFSFDRLDFFVDNAIRLGIKQFEFSHLATQWGAQFCPKIVAFKNNREEKIFGWENNSDSPEYLDFLSSFLSELAKFVAKKDMTEKISFHISDEPGETHLEHFRRLKNVITKHFPNARIMDALCQEIFYNENIVNVPAVATDHADTFNYRPETEKWVYYCSWQKKNYVSNRFFNMPSQRNRVLGFQLYLNNVKGFLHWGFNFYNSSASKYAINPYVTTDAGGSFESGDSYFVYPDYEKGGVLESIRHEVFYDGLNDYRALLLLESLYGKDFVFNLLKKNKLKGFTKYPRSAKWHLKFKLKINKFIEKKLQSEEL